MAHISLHLHPRLLSPLGSRISSSRTAEMWNNLSQSRPFLLESLFSLFVLFSLSLSSRAAHGWRKALRLLSSVRGNFFSHCRF